MKRTNKLRSKIYIHEKNDKRVKLVIKQIESEKKTSMSENMKEIIQSFYFSINNLSKEIDVQKTIDSKIYVEKYYITFY